MRAFIFSILTLFVSLNVNAAPDKSYKVLQAVLETEAFHTLMAQAMPPDDERVPSPVTVSFDDVSLKMVSGQEHARNPSHLPPGRTTVRDLCQNDSRSGSFVLVTFKDSNGNSLAHYFTTRGPAENVRYCSPYAR